MIDVKDSYKLTVIISNYNQEKYIAETIDSVFAQRVSYPFKIIIVDDHSCQDRSREIIRDYAKKHENITPIFADENRGYLTNILRAKERTKTKYFCLLDADDYWTDRDFLQRAYEFLECHGEYSIYEANVNVLSKDGETTHPYISPKCKSGSFSKKMYLNNESVPITQTTGMFLRNSIFANGIPDIMKNAIGTRSERSFEGDTGRFIMHLKYGLAYYDSRIVGVYRITENGIWTSLSKAKKQIITARFYPDYYRFYGSDEVFFVNRAYENLQRYFVEKQKELNNLTMSDEFVDEYEKLMFDDVYRFCKQYEDEIIRDRNRVMDKIRKIVRVFRE